MSIGQMIESGNMREMIRQRDEALRMLGVMVERAGHPLFFHPADLSWNRIVEAKTDPNTGIVTVDARRA